MGIPRNPTTPFEELYQVDRSIPHFSLLAILGDAFVGGSLVTASMHGLLMSRLWLLRHSHKFNTTLPWLVESTEVFYRGWWLLSKAACSYKKSLDLGESLTTHFGCSIFVSMI